MAQLKIGVLRSGMRLVVTKDEGGGVFLVPHSTDHVTRKDWWIPFSEGFRLCFEGGPYAGEVAKIRKDGLSFQERFIDFYDLEEGGVAVVRLDR